MVGFDEADANLTVDCFEIKAAARTPKTTITLDCQPFRLTNDLGISLPGEMETFLQFSFRKAISCRGAIVVKAISLLADCSQRKEFVEKFVNLPCVDWHRDECIL